MSTVPKHSTNPFLRAWRNKTALRPEPESESETEIQPEEFDPIFEQELSFARSPFKKHEESLLLHTNAILDVMKDLKNEVIKLQQEKDDITVNHAKTRFLLATVEKERDIEMKKRKKAEEELENIKEDLEILFHSQSKNATDAGKMLQRHKITKKIRQKY
jgi:hypothetical protein